MSLQEKRCPQQTDIEGDGGDGIIMSGRGRLAAVIRLGVDECNDGLPIFAEGSSHYT
jgi:hypothetical protein